MFPLKNENTSTREPGTGAPYIWHWRSLEKTSRLFPNQQFPLAKITNIHLNFLSNPELRQPETQQDNDHMQTELNKLDDSTVTYLQFHTQV